MAGIKRYRTDLRPSEIRGLINNNRYDLSFSVMPEEESEQAAPSSAEQLNFSIRHLYEWKIGELTVRASGLTPDGTIASVIIPSSDDKAVTVYVVDPSPPLDSPEDGVE